MFSADAGALWDKAHVIGATIKDTSCSYIKKIQGDSRGKINVFGCDSIGFHFVTRTIFTARSC